MSYSRFKMMKKFVNGIPTGEFTQGDLIQAGPFGTYEECQEGNASPSVTPDNPDLIYRWIVSSTPWCDGTDEYKTEKQQQSADLGKSWTDTGATRRGEFVKSHSFTCGFVAERWIEVNPNVDFICESGNKYYLQKKEISTDGVNWTDSGDKRKGPLIEANSADCGYPQYRWVEISLDVDYECVGTDKYYKEKEQITNDGIVWQDTGNTRRGRVAEVHSTDCGYVPPTTVTRWIVVEDEFICQGVNKHQKEKEQISEDSGQTWQDTGNVRAGSLIEKNSYSCGYVSFRWVDAPNEFVCQGYDKYQKQNEEKTTDGKVWTPTGRTRTGALIERNSYSCGYVSYRWVTVESEFVCSGTDKYTKEKEQSSTDGQTWTDTGNVRAGSLIERNSSYCKEDQYSSRYLTIEVVGTQPKDSGSSSGRGYGLYNCHRVSGNLVYTYFNNAQYRKNGGEWVDYNNGEHLSVEQGDKFEWRAKGRQYVSTIGGGAKFITDDSKGVNWSNSTYKIYGNINSLYEYDEFIGSDVCYDYSSLFNGFPVVDAKNLILPATTLIHDCCYAMFSGCGSLVEAPKLNATTLADYCYADTFLNCYSLQKAPELPATILKDHCYYQMLKGCSGLIDAPDLNATSLVAYCYSEMLSGCSNLRKIVMMATENTTATHCLYDFASGTDSANGCFISNLPRTSDYIITMGLSSKCKWGSAYRWVNTCYTVCEADGNKYVQQQCQYLSSSNIWINQDIYRAGALIEANSSDCANYAKNLTFVLLSENDESVWLDCISSGSSGKIIADLNQAEYRKNGGEWTSMYYYDNDEQKTITLSQNDVVEFRASNTTKKNKEVGYNPSTHKYSCYPNASYHFGATSGAEIKIYGNINSLYDYDNLTTNVYDYNISNIFKNCGTVEDKSLVIPERYKGAEDNEMVRWVALDPSVDYYCYGFTKYVKEKKQISTDCGVTWSDSAPLETRVGDVAEANCIACGYPVNNQ